jgi:hypothetical protein
VSPRYYELFTTGLLLMIDHLFVLWVAGAYLVYALQFTRLQTLDVRRLGEVHVVDGVHEVLRSDALAAEEATVQAFDGILAALDTVKLDVDLAVGGSGSNANVDDLPVATATLFLDVFLELFVPARSQGARIEVSSSVMLMKVIAKHSLFLSVQVLQQDATTRRGLIDWRLLLLSLGCGFDFGFFGSGKFAHERVA